MKRYKLKKLYQTPYCTIYPGVELTEDEIKCMVSVNYVNEYKDWFEEITIDPHLTVIDEGYSYCADNPDKKTHILTIRSNVKLNTYKMSTILNKMVQKGELQ